MNKKELIDAFVFFKTLTFRKIINGFLLRLSFFVSKFVGSYVHWGALESLSIEPTNLCNLKCPECPSGNNAMTRPRLYLAKKDFENTINQVANHLSYLQLFFQGEPFLHPKIFEYIAFAKERNIYTSISTNGQFLGVTNCEKIVNSGLQRLIISMDGTTQDVYEKYRVGGSLGLVINGIENLLETKRQLKSKTPFVIMQFVVFSTNEHQVPAVKALAKSLHVDKLEIKTAQIDNFENGNTLIPNNKKFSRYIENEKGLFTLKRKSKFKCWRVWNGSVLSAENKILPCCFDKNGAYAYNEFEGTSLQMNWKGEKARLFRKQVWKKNNEIDMCKNCTEGLR